MKTKISIIVIEVTHDYDPYGMTNVRFLVDDNYQFVSKYLSSKSLNETIQDLLYKYTSIDIRLYYPELADFVHKETELESEAIYVLKLPKDLFSVKEGYLLTADQFEIGERYERAIRRTPKSI